MFIHPLSWINLFLQSTFGLHASYCRIPIATEAEQEAIAIVKVSIAAITAETAVAVAAIQTWILFEHQI